MVVLGGCRKEKAAPLYYQFTSEDRLWFQHQRGEEWTFENGRGQRRVYRVAAVEERTKEAYACCRATFPTVLGWSGDEVRYYFDTWRMDVQRIDSANRGGTIQFRRPVSTEGELSEPLPGGSGVLGASGYWNEFIGSTLNGNLICFRLPFAWTEDVGATPHTILTVRGVPYQYVLTLSATGTQADCPGNSGLPRPGLSRIYYDRQYGIVRMESLGGEIWDRVR